MATDFFKIGQAAYGGSAGTSDVISKAIEKNTQFFLNYIQQRKQNAEKIDNLTKQYISKIPNVNAINKIPDWMRNDVNTYLVEQKQIYTDMARQLANMSSSDPAYMDVLNGMQSIQNNFITLNEQLTEFQEETKEYVEAVDQGELSRGYTLGQQNDYINASAIFGSRGELAKLNIQNGKLLFKIADGTTINYSDGELGDFYSPDYDVQNAIDVVAEQIKKDALRGINFDSMQAQYARSVQIALASGGKNRLLSLIYDDHPRFTTADGLQTFEILKAIEENNLSEARKLIADQLVQGFSTVHQGFYDQYKASKETSEPIDEDRLANMQDIGGLLKNISDLKTGEDYTNYFKNSQFNGKPVLNARIVDQPIGGLGSGKTKPVLTLTLAAGQTGTDDFSFDLSNRNQQENLFKGIVDSRYSSGATQDLAMREIRKLLDQTFSNDLPIFN
jgi:hypothetical protein